MGGTVRLRLRSQDTVELCVVEHPIQVLIVVNLITSAVGNLSQSFWMGLGGEEFVLAHHSGKVVPALVQRVCLLWSGRRGEGG